ncbi:MAG: AAA family ATPase [Patescibacteria group bacterium]
MIIELSPDQQRAQDMLMSWYKSQDRPQFITLGGYAGTGKTTLLSFFRCALNKEKSSLKVAFCSYTGKATQVLRKKLYEHKAMFKDDEIRTIHSLIYKAVTNERGQIVGWKRRGKSEVEFDLLVVDEASMVDAEIWQDLLSFQIPIVAVGDHGQLPPVSGSFNLMENPQLRLEKIHRQAEENPIIQLSVMAREYGAILHGDYGNGVRKLNMEDATPLLENIFMSFTGEHMILCGYNNSRVRLNSVVRGALGFESPLPCVNDRVICLRNNREKEIYNGMLGYIKEIKKLAGDMYKVVISMDSFGGDFLYEGLISSEQFNSSTTLNNIAGYSKTKDTDLFDFGYALTVHKAQGSQAKKVVLFEERFGKQDEDMWRRWFYTGITRAEEELLIVG